MSTGANTMDKGSNNQESERLRSQDAQPPAARNVSEGDLAAMLRNHSVWLRSSGSEGKRADLGYTNCENVTLDEARLQRAFARGANLQRTSMRGADLSEADLTDATLHGAQLQDAILRKANLYNCDFRSASLKHADLSEARGLLARQLAGADLTGATLPDETKQFEGLLHAQGVSQHAQRLFLAILAACIYTWLTIAVTTDANLLTNSASSPLPIIQTEIPIAGFYVAAPIILLGVYLYFQLYTLRLWERLAKLPAMFPDGASLDEKVDWLFIGLVRKHFANLTPSRPPLWRVQTAMSALVVRWLVPLTLLGLWGRYLTRHEPWGTLLHVMLIAIAVSTAFWFQRLTGKAFRRREAQRIADYRSWKSRRSLKLLGIVLLSVIMGVGLVHFSFWGISGGVRADLARVDVSTKPPGWTGADEQVHSVKGASLRGVDLRQARANRVFLANADLEEANLSEADLTEADLRMANLNKARLRGAYLNSSNLRGVRLRYAVLSSTDLWQANLDQANLEGATLFIVDLRGASLVGADLRGAQLVPASPRSGNPSGRARMSNLEAADLRGAILHGAYLIGTENLTQEQIDQACIDEKTKLPLGLIRPEPCEDVHPRAAWP